MITEQYTGQPNTPEQEAQARLNALYMDPKLEALAKQFGFEGFGEAEVADRTLALQAFTNDNWDFRKGKERDDAQRVELTEQLSAQIFVAARDFGGYNMVDSTEPLHDGYDIVTILGGANDGPLLRVRYAKEQIKKLSGKPKFMVLLGSARPLGDKEKLKTDAYAPDAEIEFDLMNAAVETEYHVHSVEEASYVALSKKGEAPTDPAQEPEFWKVRRYITEDGMEIMSVCAPQIDGRTRANTADTYRFMREVMGRDMLEGKNILNVTHAVYTAFQDLDARRYLGLPMGANIETIGFEAGYNGTVRKADALLQEMNSSANSGARLQATLNKSAA